MVVSTNHLLSCDGWFFNYIFKQYNCSIYLYVILNENNTNQNMVFMDLDNT